MSGQKKAPSGVATTEGAGFENQDHSTLRTCPVCKGAGTEDGSDGMCEVSAGDSVYDAPYGCECPRCHGKGRIAA